MAMKIRYIKGKSIIRQYYFNKWLTQKNEALTVPVTDIESLETGIERTYRDAFNILIEALDELSHDWPDPETGGSEGPDKKALNNVELSVTVLDNVQKMDLAKTIANVIGKSTAKTVLNTMFDQSQKLNIPLDETTEQYALTRLVERKMSYYQDIPDTLTNTVMTTLEKGIQDGLSWQDVRKELQVLRDDFTKNRASVIARNELGRSHKEAVQIFGEKHKDKLNKRWRATRDHRTRNSHMEMDGVVIPVDEAFKVNYKLDNPKYGIVYEMTPGESKHGIQCRCNMTLERK